MYNLQPVQLLILAIVLATLLALIIGLIYGRTSLARIRKQASGMDTRLGELMVRAGLEPGFSNERRRPQKTHESPVF